MRRGLQKGAVDMEKGKDKPQQKGSKSKSKNKNGANKVLDFGKWVFFLNAYLLLIFLLIIMWRLESFV